MLAHQAKKTLSVSLAIIARNEKESSKIIFPKIPTRGIRAIFLIDGNSTDGTQEFYKKHGVKVFKQKVQGLGGAVIEARKHCKTDAMVFFHPDGNENPKDITTCVTALKNGAQIVIPSRMIKGGYNEEDSQFIKPRKWFNKTLAYFVNFIWKKEKPFVSEIVQGFRGIRCDTFDKLKLDVTGPAIDFQMVIRALKYNIPIYEFPTQEGKRLFGVTNFPSFKTGIAELTMLWRELFDQKTYPKKGLLN